MVLTVVVFKKQFLKQKQQQSIITLELVGKENSSAQPDLDQKLCGYSPATFQQPFR